MKRIVAAGVLASVVALSGCAYLPPSLQEVVESVVPAIQGAAIGSLEQARDWVETVADSITGPELAGAVSAVASLVPTLGLPALATSELGQRLADLDARIRDGVGTIAEHVAAFRSILADIGAAR